MMSPLTCRKVMAVLAVLAAVGPARELRIGQRDPARRQRPDQLHAPTPTATGRSGRLTPTSQRRSRSRTGTTTALRRCGHPTALASHSTAPVTTPITPIDQRHLRDERRRNRRHQADTFAELVRDTGMVAHRRFDCVQFHNFADPAEQGIYVVRPDGTGMRRVTNPPTGTARSTTSCRRASRPTDAASSMARSGRQGGAPWTSG